MTRTTATANIFSAVEDALAAGMNGTEILSVVREGLQSEEPHPVTSMLAGMVDKTAAPSEAYMSDLRTGRAPTGRLRNFRQMRNAKLLDVLSAVTFEDNDAEALEALEAECEARGLRVF